MRIYPAIDIINGQAVRLSQGDYNQLEVFHQQPVEQAKAFLNAGASLIHVVDLDGAKAGHIVNFEVIEQLTKLNIPIEVGGGIRTLDAIEKLLAIGVKRVILGSVAINNFSLLAEAIQKFGNEKIVVGIDAKNGNVAVHGWLDVSSIRADELCIKLKAIGVKTIIYTDIAKDGMLQGPNLVETKHIKNTFGLEVVASGGISSADDVDAVSKIADGVIIGKAIYANAVDLSSLIKKYEGSDL